MLYEFESCWGYYGQEGDLSLPRILTPPLPHCLLGLGFQLQGEAELGLLQASRLSWTLMLPSLTSPPNISSNSYLILGGKNK